MSRFHPLFGVILLTSFLSGAGLWACGGEASAGFGLRQFVYLGGRLLELKVPAAGDPLPMGAARLVIRFPDEDRVLPSTLRCRLNGRDVTPLLTVGGNGAAGAVYPLREGANTLRIEIFGRGLWGEAFYQDSVEIVLHVRGNPALDRA